MTQIWFTSDHHFGHANIIKYTKRPFESVEEMDAEMIKRWNERVAPSDIVYHLGDFTLGGIDEFWKYAKQLNGNINIIWGGHDKRWLPYFSRHPECSINLVGNMYITDEILPKKGGHPIAITMCHYPMLSWEQSHYGAPHLHGHTHGTIGVISRSGDKQLPPNQKQGIRVDLSVENWNYCPLSLDKVLELTNGN